MKIALTINHFILIILGAATGLVKVFGLEADVEIFATMGFSYNATVFFGVIQAAAAVMLIFPKTRRYGAIILGISFVIATIGLFVSGMIPFGLFSILFIAMAAVEGLLNAGPAAGISRNTNAA